MAKSLIFLLILFIVSACYVLPFEPAGDQDGQNIPQVDPAELCLESALFVEGSGWFSKNTKMTLSFAKDCSLFIKKCNSVGTYTDLDALAAGEFTLNITESNDELNGCPSVGQFVCSYARLGDHSLAMDCGLGGVYGLFESLGNSH